MQTKWLRKCVAALDASDKFYVGVADGAMAELAAIEEGYAALVGAAAGAMDVMSEAIENGLQIGDADWAQMIKCKEAISAAILSSC